MTEKKRYYLQPSPILPTYEGDEVADPTALRRFARFMLGPRSLDDAMYWALVEEIQKRYDEAWREYGHLAK